LSVPPLSLYVHMPWCVRKCPYCDFNSHAAPSDEQGGVPETAYIAALLQDLDQDLADFLDSKIGERELVSIFIGGGTPSLISPAGYATLFAGLRQRLRFADDIEITLEANPGTVEQGLFQGYREVGINRLSIGVQTFQTAQLKALGRIHSGDEAQRAALSAREAGFSNFNLDLMHGLPGQSLEQALDDLRQAIALEPTHLSWYQLTLEPNTVFFREQPVLPDEDVLADIQDAGQALLAAEGYVQYEVSAYARRDRRCRHNLNYWQFGDYLGIGAGAHGKLTQVTATGLHILRTSKTRVPKDYLATMRVRVAETLIAAEALPFEFMLNTLRLIEGVSTTLWSERTGLSPEVLAETVTALQHKGLLQNDANTLVATALGQRYLNRVIEAFLPE
jgi:putative oxygen-independent coproporphyrinogen III oxidase